MCSVNPKPQTASSNGQIVRPVACRQVEVLALGEVGPESVLLLDLGRDSGRPPPRGLPRVHGDEHPPATPGGPCPPRTKLVPLPIVTVSLPPAPALPATSV